MSVKALVALLSLHATTQLVAAGYTAPFYNAPNAPTSLTVTDATNATPIVVATSVAHGVPSRGAHVVVSGVVGNAAANNLDTEDGVTPNAWVAVPTDDTHLALYSVDTASGALTASTGSSPYSFGGTVQQAFTDGMFLLGRQHIFEQSTPPRIVFIPRSSGFGPKSVASRFTNAAADEIAREQAQRSIGTDKKTFEVHVWGAASAPDPDDDFDATEVLYQQVLRTTHLLASGVYAFGDGQWADQQPTASQNVKSGHEFVFTLSLATPVLDKLLERAPSDVAALPTTILNPGDGSTTETGCTG
jgi:hypothetical protein